MYEADDGFAGTAPVGQLPQGQDQVRRQRLRRQRVGVDRATGSRPTSPTSRSNPKGAPAGDRKAIRGGGFNGGVVLWLNPAFRYHQVPTASAPAIGFRCAMSM